MKRCAAQTMVNAISILALLLFGNSLFWAQEYSYSANEGYQGRVVRLSLVEGDVSIQHGPNDSWLDAAINVPLVPGDRLWTGAQGRTEIEFDNGNYVRLASNSVLEIQQLDLNSNGNYSQIFLSQGLAYIYIRENNNDTFRVTTPSLAADVFGSARYRLSVDGREDLTVFRGEVIVNSAAGNATVRSHELFSLAENDSRYSLGSAPGNDAWDRWNFDRDSNLAQATSSRYVPSSVGYGVYDLDSYGHWVDQPGYGYVWTPYNVDPDWVPYSYGRWVYSPAFGYYWSSYEPWGWLPYHYGGWSWIDGFGWGWSPGAQFNYWSPARVFFFNFGGYRGWCPWSPFDTYYGGGGYINVSHYRPRNFANNRVIIVNNNTFANNVVRRDTIVRNHEVLRQITTSNSLQFTSQPRVQRTAFSEEIRPASAFNKSTPRIASDTKGWNREDVIQGTGARPPEALRMAQPFQTGKSGGTGRGGVMQVPGASPGTRSDGINRPSGNTAGRSATSVPPRNQSGGREVIQNPGTRTPYSGGNNSNTSRSEGRSPGYSAPPANNSPRTESARPSGSYVETPRSPQYQAPKQEQPRYTPPPAQNRQEPPKNQEKPKAPPPDKSGLQSSYRNYAQGNSAIRENFPASANSDRSSYSAAPPTRANNYAQVQRNYSPPPAVRNESRSSYGGSPQRYSAQTYSAPAPRYEAPRYSAPQVATPRYEAPRQSNYQPPVARQSFSRPSAPPPQFHSAPAPRVESRSAPSGNNNARRR
jgi:hypothetical protein